MPVQYACTLACACTFSKYCAFSEYKSPTHLGLGGLVEPGECLQHVEDEHVAAELEAELAQ